MLSTKINVCLHSIESTQKFKLVDVEEFEDIESLAKNSKKIAGSLRKAVEQSFSGMKGDKFWSSTIHYRYLRTFSEKTVKRLK